MQILLLLLLPLILEEPVQAEEPIEIVVTADRLRTDAQELGQTAIVLKKEDLKSTVPSVSELIRKLTSVSIARNGSSRGFQAISIRGIPSEHTLVLIDGVVVNDPISTTRTYDFSQIQLHQIERIEVIPGPQSALYGSDSIGGVIHILTQKGSGEPKTVVTTGVGSYATVRGSVHHSGEKKGTHYSVGLNYEQSAGISAASSKLSGNSERDGDQALSLAARSGTEISENLEIDWVVRASTHRSDLDQFGGASGDDPNFVSRNRKLLLRPKLKWRLFEDFWEQTYQISYYQLSRQDINDLDVDHPDTSLDSKFISERVGALWQNDLHFPKNIFSTGIQIEHEKGKFDTTSQSALSGKTRTVLEKKTGTTLGIFAQDKIKNFEPVLLTLGGRYDQHSGNQESLSARGMGQYLFSPLQTQFHLTYGTGFKTPSLYQLHSRFGNLSLKPETSTSFSTGLSQPISSFHFGGTYFITHLHQMIVFRSVKNQYENINRAVSEGFEFFLDYQPQHWLKVETGFTLLNTEDEEEHKPLLRKPKHKAKLNVEFQPIERASIEPALIYVGKRDDLNESLERVPLAAYRLLNLDLEYRFSPELKTRLQFENLLNEDYEEVKGYGTKGRSYFAAIQWTL